jgi:DNA-binding NarL/FixJ family response regulator
MKVLLITFDKEMEKKIRELLKEHQVISAKNGEEALLLDTADVDIVIYDALAGGLAEEDINKLYEEAFKDKPFLILMDDLFPIEPSNVKPKVKKIVSREVDVDKIPQLVNELVSKAGTGATQEEQPAAPAQAAPPPAEEEKKEEAPAAEESWESLFGTNVVQPRKKEGKPVQAAESSTTLQPAEVSPQPPKEEKQKPETPSEGQITLTPPTEQKQPSQPPQEAKAAESKAEEKPLPESPPTKKQCLLVSFDIPLVEKIDQLIGDLCDLYTARSAKQALQKYGDKDFDIIIFDTISGVFAEKGIKDLYEKGGYKDALYVVLLDEFMPIDIDPCR